MESSDDPAQPKVKLQIAFPKSDQDHRLQLIQINDSIFAIVHSPLESNGPINLHCEDWSLILLAPIKSKTNIVISAMNVICLSEIQSEDGEVSIHASNRLVKFGQLIKSPKESSTIAEGGAYQIDDDLGAVLYFHRIYKEILNGIHISSPESFKEMQQKFIMSLGLLTEKVQKTAGNSNLLKVLEFWGISKLG